MKRVMAFLVLGVALTACAGTGTASSHATASLNGTSWTLVEIDGREPAGDAVPTLAFDEAGNVSGSAGCNTFMGTPTIEGSSISMGPLGTTRVACSGAAGLTETAFLAAMNEVESFAIDSQGRLVMEDGVVLVFEPAEEAPAS
ncbi:MAG TPA: META domain-containing protein [Candidatus Limnocylindria bacterium]|jgi:putative lipoprotein